MLCFSRSASVRLNSLSGLPPLVEATRGKIERVTPPRAMFERFTEKAIKVIMLGLEEARRLGHNFVGTEMILLGIIGEGTGVSLRDARDGMMDLFLLRYHSPLALVEANCLGHNYIAPEHLLLGLLHEGDGVAIQVLENLGANLSYVRKQVIRERADQKVEPATVSGEGTKTAYS